MAAGGGRKASAGLFLAPFGQGGSRITEAFVLCKFRLSRRDKLFPLQDIVDIVQRIAPALPEEGIEHLAVKALSAAALQRLPEHLGLHGPVAAERGIAPAEQDEVRPGLRRDGGQVLRDFPLLRPALRCGKPAGIGQNEEHPLRCPEGFRQGLLVPAGVDIDIVYGLYAGGIVVQDDNLSVQAVQRLREPRPDLSAVRWKMLQGFSGKHRI